MKPNQITPGNMGAAELGNLIDEKAKEIKEHLTTYYTLEQEKLLLQKEILERQVKKKDIEVALSKSAHILKTMGIDQGLLKSAFYNAKNSGL